MQEILVLFEHLKSMPKDSVMLLSSHRIDEIKGLVNRVIEMDCGKILSDESFDIQNFNNKVMKNTGITLAPDHEVK